jgi:hypothetical protein
MRKKRDPQTEQQRDARSEQEAQRRVEKAAEEDSAIDAMVKQSIKFHGP